MIIQLQENMMRVKAEERGQLNMSKEEKELVDKTRGEVLKQQLPLGLLLSPWSPLRRV